MKSIFCPWLISFYRWYGRETGFSGPDFENFCRFGRIVLIWAPLLALWKFLNARLLGPVQLWMVALFAGYISLWILLPQIALAITVAAAASALLMLFLLKCSEQVIAIVMSCALTAVVVLLAVTQWDIFLKILLALVITVLLVVALVGIVWGIDALVQRIRKRFPGRGVSRRSPQVLHNIGGVASVGWHWLLVMKRKTICPWVRMTPDGYIQFYWSGDVPEEQA